MWLIGTYKDINNNTITVKIRNEKNGDNIELGGALVKFAAEDAVTIECDRDDYFTHIIKKSATIRLVTRIYLGDYLWAANQKSVIVNILRNGKCVFAGYVTPNTYTQEYVEEWTALDVHCRDLLSTLEDTNFVDKDKYDDFKQNAQTISLKDYLKLFGIMNANLNLDNYPQPMFMSHFIWITDGYIYQDGVFYAKLIEVEQVTIDGQVKNIATGNYKRGKVLEPNWILDETKTTTYNGLKYNLEFAYLDIDGNGTYETRTNVSRRTAEPIFDQVYRDAVTYGDVIEQIHLEEYTVITNVTRTYVVDYGIHKAGDVEHLRGMEHCPFELRDEPNVSVLRRYVWVYYGNEWHKTNFYEDTDIPVTPVEPAKDYLCFTSTGNSTVKMCQNNNQSMELEAKVIKYKLNDGQWKTWNYNERVSLADGDKMYVKSDDTIPMSEIVWDNVRYKYFGMTGSIAASGNVMSLFNFSDTLTEYGLYGLFKDCTALTSAPTLSATTLAPHCYRFMFNGCTSLTYVPTLPATTLAVSCYAYMFQDCTSLVQAPELPAIELVEDCYFHMFEGCKKLNYVKAMFTSDACALPTGFWLKGVSETGTFIKNRHARWDPDTANIPHGWTVKIADVVTPEPEPGPEQPTPEQDYLCFTSTGDSTVAMTQKGTPTDISNGKVIQYKLNDGQWQTWDLSAITLVDGDKMYIKSDDTIPMSESNSIHKMFVMTGSIAASGNTMSLLNFSTTLTDYAFFRLFFNCRTLTQAPVLPATTLAENCYYQMFYYCQSLTAAPELPATTLAPRCYYSMFYSCKSFTTTPALPATTLTDYCYYGMFNGCTSLTAAPELPATTLAYGCYCAMFYNCSSLTQAPELPATTLADSCYYQMFCYCQSLTTAPELHATTLTDRCYLEMFQYCKKLNYVKAMFTDISTTYCLDSWLDGVSPTGTFVKNANATWTNTDAGIPSGWTVQTE